MKLLYGKVISSNKDVTGITIQNLNSERATITDFEGNFSIRASVGDTLVFSAVQFKRKIVPVSQAFFDSPFVQVSMKEFVNELTEVTVQPYGLSGDINKDVNGLQLEKDVSAEALGLPNANVRIITQSENKLNDADHGKFLYFYGLGFALNLNKTLNRLSGRTKMLKERVALDASYKKTKALEAKFLDSLILAELRIPKDRFYDFIRYCEADNDFKAYSNGYDELILWEFLKKKSVVYRVNNDLK